MEKDAPSFLLESLLLFAAEEDGAAADGGDEDVGGCCGLKSVSIPPNDWLCCNVGEVRMSDLLAVVAVVGSASSLTVDLKLESSSMGSDFTAGDGMVLLIGLCFF